MPVTISTWQSIHRLPKTFFSEFKAVYGDECHLFKAKSLTDIMVKSRDVKYRFGLTGTLDGTQTHRLVLEGLFGKVKKIITTKVDINNEISEKNCGCHKFSCWLA